MKFKLPEGTFPPLELSPQEAEAITQEAQRMVLETIGEFDDMVANHRELSRDRWKFVKTRENLAVYRTRKGYDYKYRTGSSASWSPQAPHLVSGSTYAKEEALERARKAAVASMTASGSSSGGGARPQSDQMSSSTSDNGSFRDRLDSELGVSMLEASKPRRTPIVVATGFYSGTVEDSALGNLADTEVLWKLRSAFIDDERDDYKILATLQRPTPGDPFRFLGVKWSTKKFAFFTTQRDLLFVESSGVIRDPSTGKITTHYSLLRSIEIPRIPELRKFDIIRIKLSLCFISRQYDESRIELFCRGFTALGGDMIGAVTTTLVANAMLLAANVIACAYAKKLMWLTQQRRLGNVPSYTTKTVETATHCHSCTKSFKGLSEFLRSSAACQCCKRIVCGKCCVEMKLVIDITSDEVTQRAMPFCLQCVLEVKQLSALEIATATAPAPITLSTRSSGSNSQVNSRGASASHPR